ncbi:hypothetical protein ES703_98612 [subsurface metagenome]
MIVSSVTLTFAVTKTTKLELLQAKDAGGGSSKTLAEALITANVKVTELTITLVSVLNGEIITINGLDFTGHTDTTDVTLRQFSIATSDTAAATELCVCINDPTYGVPGITATSNLGVVTLVSTDPGATLLTVTSEDATFTIATTEAQACVDIEGLVLDEGFSHIAVKVTTTADSNDAVILIRYHSRKGIEQKVGSQYPAA